MARLIDADKLIEKEKQMDSITHGMVMAVQSEHIIEAPTVDAVEVKHGRWIPKTYDSEPYQFILQHCSECGTPCAVERNFCAYCGAKMDGDGNA